MQNTRNFLAALTGAMIFFAFLLMIVARNDITRMPSLPSFIAIEQPAKIITSEIPSLLPDIPIKQTLNLKQGQNLIDLLISVKISKDEAHKWANSIRKIYNTKNLRPKFDINIQRLPKENRTKENQLKSINIQLAEAKMLDSNRNSQGDIISKQKQLTLSTKLNVVNGTIQHSLYKNATDKGIPESILYEMIKEYSFDVDFQRDIHKGDTYQILYETHVIPNGKIMKYGNILSMNLTTGKLLGGKPNALYRFENKDGIIDYYSENGQSVTKALLKTPINGARLSSGYGYRKHPILGYNKLHKGTDFAAPTGTPIFAAGDGRVEAAGRNGAYGKYIRIQHPNKYKTAYAHLSKIASKIRRGSKVKQGQIIGYVGSTGRSTGPHLHYEIIYKNKAINPKKLKLPSGIKLNATELAEFKQHALKLKQLVQSLIKEKNIANTENKNVATNTPKP